MIKRKTKDISRRDFFKKALGALPVGMLSSGPFFLFPERARRHRKELKILRWRYPLSEYDQWFEEVFAGEWELFASVRQGDECDGGSAGDFD